MDGETEKKFVPLLFRDTIVDLALYRVLRKGVTFFESR